MSRTEIPEARQLLLSIRKVLFRKGPTALKLHHSDTEGSDEMKKTTSLVFACLALLFLVLPAFALTDEEFLDTVLNDEVEKVRAALAAGQNPNFLRTPARQEMLRLTPSKIEVPGLPVQPLEIFVNTKSGDENVPTPPPAHRPSRKSIRHEPSFMATPLSVAVANGSLEMLRVLIDGGADVDMLDRDSGSALFFVGITRQSQQKALEIFRLLIDAGANVNVRNSRGKTPLFYVLPLKAEVVKMLLDAGADPNTADDGGKTPLHHLAMGTTSILLLPRPPLPFRSLEQAKLLILSGADVSARDAYGTTVLIAALKATPNEAQLEFVRLLLKAGADPNQPDAAGFFPIYYAIAGLKVSGHPLDRGRKSFVEALLNADASPDPGGPALSPLAHLGRVTGKSGGREDELMNMLLAAGANVNAVDSREKSVLQHWLDADPSGTRRLIRAGADVDFVRIGIPLIAYAAGSDSRNLNVLIEEGADVEAFVPDGLSPLFIAAAGGNAAAVATLLDAGANPNRKTNGLVPLHAFAELCRSPYLAIAFDNFFSFLLGFDAEKRHRTDIARFLVEAGADVNAPVLGNYRLAGSIPVEGATPLDLARLLRERCLASYLESVGGQMTDLSKNVNMDNHRRN